VSAHFVLRLCALSIAVFNRRRRRFCFSSSSRPHDLLSTVKFFPHAVADLEPALMFLQKQSSADFETWHTRYSLLLWLSMIVLIPFDLSTVDSHSSNAHGGDEKSPVDTHERSRGPIVATLVSVAQSYLSDAGPTRDMAAVLLSRLFSRPDLQGSGRVVCIGSFIEWACTILRDSRSDRFLVRANDWCRCFVISFVNSRSLSLVAGLSFVFLLSLCFYFFLFFFSFFTHLSCIFHAQLTGVYQCLAHIFKLLPRDSLLPFVPSLYAIINVTSSTSNVGNVMFRKLSVKLLQRVALTFLAPRDTTWRYEMGVYLCLNDGH
jgi:hypothetical protein